MADTYVTRPKAWGEYDDQPAMHTTITVHDSEDKHEPTGLLDMYGRELYRVRETVPMGIHRR